MAECGKLKRACLEEVGVGPGSGRWNGCGPEIVAVGLGEVLGLDRPDGGAERSVGSDGCCGETSLVIGEGSCWWRVRGCPTKNKGSDNVGLGGSVFCWAGHSDRIVCGCFDGWR